MKPNYLKVLTDNTSSFKVRKEKVPYWQGKLFYHDEIEIMTILEGTGTRFIGDNIESFTPGEVIVVGSKLPHMWHSDEKYFKAESTLYIEAIIIQFKPEFLGKEFLSIPEMQEINHFLEKSIQGFRVHGDILSKFQRLIQDIFDVQDSFQKLIMLLNLLKTLSSGKNGELTAISSKGFINDYTKLDAYRINEIYDYAMKNYRKKIDLDEISKIANMSRSAFCRYFKFKTSNTFTQLINEIRIGNACKMIMEDKFTISQICYNVGFQNLSNFNRQFKKIMHLTPLNYKRKFLNK